MLVQCCTSQQTGQKQKHLCFGKGGSLLCMDTKLKSTILLQKYAGTVLYSTHAGTVLYFSTEGRSRSTCVMEREEVVFCVWTPN